MTFDPAGNIIAVGYGLAGTSQYTYDIFVVKLDQNGDTAWMHIYDSDSLDQAFEVETGADGSIYVVGLTDIEQYRRPLLIKYGPAGDIIWTYFGKSGTEFSICVLFVAYLYKNESLPDGRIRRCPGSRGLPPHDQRVACMQLERFVASERHDEL